MVYITKKKHNKTIKKKIRKTIKKYGKLTKNKNKNKKHYTKRIIRNKKSIIQKGGDTPNTSIIKYINFFNKSNMKKPYEDIEEYLNPVYGVIMCETGYITNNFWLGKKHDDLQEGKKHEDLQEDMTDEMKFVFKTSRPILPNIQPKIDIMKYVNTYDIGNYIALLYFYNKTQNGEIFNKLYHEFKLRKNQEKDKEEIEEKNNINIVIKEKEKNKDNFNRAFGLISSNFNVGQNKEPKYNKPFSKEMFHILLYCLWWVSNNMDGIQSYYNGINNMFTLINDSNAKLHDSKKFVHLFTFQTPIFNY